MPATISILSRLSVSFFFEIIYAPVWWYTRGLFWFVTQMGNSIGEAADSAALRLWVKNLFVPMYGQYDFWGRIVSFIIRLANIIGRALWVGIWAIMCISCVLLWIVVPILLFFTFFSSLIRLLYV